MHTAVAVAGLSSVEGVREWGADVGKRMGGDDDGDDDAADDEAAMRTLTGVQTGVTCAVFEL